MAHKEILLVAEVFSNEKDIDKEIVFEAMESALEAATINVEFPASQILLEAARMEDQNIQIGDVVQEEIESVEFGRIAAQTAKQVIIHKVREAERKKIVEAYHSRVGELITGIVKRIEKGNVFLDLGGHVEGYIAKEDMIPKEAIRNGDRIRGYLKDVRSEPRGPQLFISRTAPELLIALFRLEVPEVNEGMISIMAAARDPGSRAKIAVKGNDPRLDPVPVFNPSLTNSLANALTSFCGILTKPNLLLMPWHLLKFNPSLLMKTSTAWILPSVPKTFPRQLVAAVKMSGWLPN
jgi:N utilization substance protein A